MDKGWMAWAAQAAELHTYRADFENRKKEGRGFYKLSNESIASVHEDLAKDYRELAEQHSEELSQLLDDLGKSQEELLDHLMERRTTQHAVPVNEPETTGVEGPTDYPEGNNPHESDDPTHNEQTQRIESPQPEVGFAAPITQPKEELNTPAPATQEGNISTSPFTPGEGHPPRNDLAEAIMPEVHQEERTEPSIIDILEAE